MEFTASHNPGIGNKYYDGNHSAWIKAIERTINSIERMKKTAGSHSDQYLRYFALVLIFSSDTCKECFKNIASAKIT